MRILPFALLALVALLGCGAEPPATCGAPGAARECPCPGRGPGVQECGPGGAWTACECPPWPDGGAPDADVSAPMDTPAEAAADAPMDASQEAEVGEEAATPPDAAPDAGCAEGFADCDRDTANGCEANLRTDPTHCGACGARCVLDHVATAACEAASCRVAVCAPSYGDCDRNAENGCEVNIRTTLAHCGACGTPCTSPNAATTCSSGVCVRGACTAGFGDCDGDPANGCEEPLNTDDRCGACTRGCTSERRCSSGVCVPR